RSRHVAARQSKTILIYEFSTAVESFEAPMIRRLVFALAALSIAASAHAQQRPLVTEDPETIGAGRILVEGGLDWANQAHYPASGLEGDLLRLPTIGVSFGISSIAEFQIDGGLHDRLS